MNDHSPVAERSQSSWLIKVLREPLVHFLLLGGGLFLLAGVYPGDSAPQPVIPPATIPPNAPTAKVPEQTGSQPSHTIVVNEERIKHLNLMWQRTWQRPPTKKEMQGVIENYIQEEVFYREALRMGLDRDDTLIRRRLRQKMEFLAEDAGDMVEPTDQELQQYLQEHPDSFREEDQVTFRQVFLNPEKHGKSLDSDARELLARLRNDKEKVDPATLGDPTLLPHFYKKVRPTEIANRLGPSFASRVTTLATGNWSDPIESGYGVHLVLVEERIKGRLPRLKKIRKSVEREWLAARRLAFKKTFYADLRKRYKVIIQMPESERKQDHPSSSR